MALTSTTPAGPESDYLILTGVIVRLPAFEMQAVHLSGMNAIAPALKPTTTMAAPASKVVLLAKPPRQAATRRQVICVVRLSVVSHVPLVI